MYRKLIGALVGVALIGCGAFLIAPTSASATIINDSATGLTTPDTLIDFGDGLFGSTTLITTQFAGDGVLFGPNYVYSDNGDLLPALTEGYLSAVSAIVQPGPISFTSDVSAAVFSFRTQSGTTTFVARLDGAVVESFAGATDTRIATGRFYGFEGIVFDEISFSIGATSKGFTLDNLQFTVADVPEPTTLALFAFGLAGLGFMTRRRRNRRRQT